jgi:GT2 family glycosyltransferase
MTEPIKVVDFELSRPIKAITGLADYASLRGLVRLHGRPLGEVEVPVEVDQCSREDLGNTILDELGSPLIDQLISNWLINKRKRTNFKIEELLESPPHRGEGEKPVVTVAVCTRNRTAGLEKCLGALLALDYPRLDLLVVDNAPADDATLSCVRFSYPQVRYVREPRPGLNWARNRAILEAKGEIIAFTDDDVTVDPGWVESLAQIFMEEPDVMAVTGLVVPRELDSEAQILFEKYGGFGRGYQRSWYSLNLPSKGRAADRFGGAGMFGTGANMAYRRSLFERIGYFDPALDVGTVTNGGGDLEMFFRVLVEGYTLVYEPRAIVRHGHRRDYPRLREQLANNGIGFYSYLVRSALSYPQERIRLLKLGVWWFGWWNVRRLLFSFFRPSLFPRDLIWAELVGSLKGLGRYPRSRKDAIDLARQYSPTVPDRAVDPQTRRQVKLDCDRAVSVRTIDLSEPIQAIKGVEHYRKARVYVTWEGYLIGSVDMDASCKVISPSRLVDCIVSELGLRILEPVLQRKPELIWTDIMSSLAAWLARDPEKAAEMTTGVEKRHNKPVSIVVATYDRPDDLRSCLQSLKAQETRRPVEIIVVDNHPETGLTPPVVSAFSDVLLLNEPRKGLSYARNTGIAHSFGEIIITTDDDVEMPSNWLEKMVAQFSRNDVMIVTGNVLPKEMDTQAQKLFEVYGGLGRGFKPREVSKEWFDHYRFKAIPTWELGATANAAFRARLFHHPHIGLMEESLGAGSPTGCSEDTYLFYRVLKAGYTIVYEPRAFVWHKHRRDMKALRRQIYNYSKGHVAYQMTTLFKDQDLRALVRLFVELPLTYLWRIRTTLAGKSDYPLSIAFIEVAGNLAGPWALWQSLRRVKRLGRSQPYIPVLQRPQVKKDTGFIQEKTHVLPVESAVFKDAAG